MAIILQDNEHVFYPQPYMPDEPAELVITNRRMVRVTEMGMAEFNVSEIEYVGRVSKRPLATQRSAGLGPSGPNMRITVTDSITFISNVGNCPSQAVPHS